MFRGAIEASQDARNRDRLVAEKRTKRGPNAVRRGRLFARNWVDTNRARPLTLVGLPRIPIAASSTRVQTKSARRRIVPRALRRSAAARTACALADIPPRRQCWPRRAPVAPLF